MQQGTRIGDYQLLQKIGHGRVTVRWRARHTVLESEHEVRVLLPQWAEDERVAAGFLEATRTLLPLKLAGIPRVTDALDNAMVSDPVEGTSLRERLRAQGWLAPQEAVSLTKRVLAVLQGAHQAGLVHGRLDPDAILIHEGEVTLLGFGEALAGVDPPVSLLDDRMVTYLAPECIDGAAPDAAADVFAVGAILWEMLAGQPPFAGKTAFAAMAACRAAKPGSPDRHGEVPGWLEDTVAAALAPRRARFTEVSAFSAALEAGPRGADLPVDPREVPPTDRAGLNALVIFGLAFGGIALLSIAITGLLAWWVWLQRPGEIHQLTVTSDSCGNVTIDTDVYSTGSVEFWVDNQLVYTDHVSGRQHLTHTVARAPGSHVAVEVQAHGDQALDTHQVQGSPLTLAFKVGGQPRAGQVGQTRVWIQGSCPPEGLRYRAMVPGQPVKEGQVAALPSKDPGHPLDLDTTALGPGRHRVTVELLDGEKVVHTGSKAVLVGEAAPADDQDLDGYHVDVDCNDEDPAVNPGQPELPIPNGVDDNCDGYIDEGTTAYDDDGDHYSEEQGDCDDADPFVFPNQVELANCRDDDCDGAIDEEAPLPAVDDAYEPNDARNSAYDLVTQGQRHFQQQVELVASTAEDAAWFRFYSQDGDFDEWGIDVQLPRIPANSRFEVEVYGPTGAVRASSTLSSAEQMLRVRGQALHDDSGDYLLVVKPTKLYADWCPYTVSITSR